MKKSIFFIFSTMYLFLRLKLKLNEETQLLSISCKKSCKIMDGLSTCHREVIKNFDKNILIKLIYQLKVILSNLLNSLNLIYQKDIILLGWRVSNVAIFPHFIKVYRSF